MPAGIQAHGGRAVQEWYRVNSDEYRAFRQKANGFVTRVQRDGRFRFEHVPPGRVMIARKLVLRREFTQVELPDHSVVLDAEPGRKMQAMLGGRGRPVAGRIVGPKGETFDFSSRFAYGSIRPPRPDRPNLPEHAKTMSREQFQTFWKDWWESREGRVHLAKLRAGRVRYGFPVQADGSFRVEDIPAGEYLLTVDVFELNHGPSWGPGPRLGQIRHKFTIPGLPPGTGKEALTLSELRLGRSAR